MADQVAAEDDSAGKVGGDRENSVGVGRSEDGSGGGGGGGARSWGSDAYGSHDTGGSGGGRPLPPPLDPARSEQEQRRPTSPPRVPPAEATPQREHELRRQGGLANGGAQEGLEADKGHADPHSHLARDVVPPTPTAVAYRPTLLASHPSVRDVVDLSLVSRPPPAARCASEQPQLLKASAPEPQEKEGASSAAAQGAAAAELAVMTCRTLFVQDERQGNLRQTAEADADVDATQFARAMRGRAARPARHAAPASSISSLISIQGWDSPVTCTSPMSPKSAPGAGGAGRFDRQSPHVVAAGNGAELTPGKAHARIVKSTPPLACVTVSGRSLLNNSEMAEHSDAIGEPCIRSSSPERATRPPATASKCAPPDDSAAERLCAEHRVLCAHHPDTRPVRLTDNTIR